MKKLLICLATLAIIASVGVMKVEAAEDTIAVTVTMQNISVAVSPDAWVMGTIPASAVRTQVCTATNNGNVREDLDIAVATTTGTWTAGLTPGDSQYVMAFSLTGLEPWTAFNTGVDLRNDLDPGSQAFTLQFTAPSSSTDYNQQSITVTVSATATL